MTSLAIDEYVVVVPVELTLYIDSTDPVTAKSTAIDQARAALDLIKTQQRERSTRNQLLYEVFSDPEVCFDVRVLI